MMRPISAFDVAPGIYERPTGATQEGAFRGGGGWWVRWWAGWPGCLRIGGLQMRLDKRDKRCVMVNVDPLTGRRDPAVLPAIARQRQVCFGVYGSVVALGQVAVGDPVVLDR